MATRLVMPQLGPAMKAGIIIEWCRQEGEQVVHDETLYVVKAKKAAFEVAAPHSGMLDGIRVKVGQSVLVGEVVAFLLQPGEVLSEIIEREMQESRGQMRPHLACGCQPAPGKETGIAGS